MFRFVMASLGLCSAILIGGCPGDLSNRDAFGDGGVGVKDAETILVESCGIANCHDDVVMASGLDLLSPNVEDRLVDVNAVGIGCTSQILAVAGDPDSSYLIAKVENTAGICGLPMPVAGVRPPLSQEEIDVLRDWITDLGSSAVETMDGG